MSKKVATIFVCNECGYESSKWLGKCPACNSWNSFVEEKQVTSNKSGAKDKEKNVNKVVKLDEVIKTESTRIETGI